MGHKNSVGLGGLRKLGAKWHRDGQWGTKLLSLRAGYPSTFQDKRVFQA